MPIHADVIARLDERSSRASADQLVRTYAEAGTRAGTAFSAGTSAAMSASSTAAVSKFNNAIEQYAAALPSRMATHGQKAGDSFGTSFGAQLARSLPGISGFSTMLGGYDGAAGKMGAVAGRALGLAFTTAATGLIGAAAYTMFKGFERYEAIDAAKNRLENLNRTLTATGKAGIDVKAVMDTVNKVVLDTPFALDKAFSVATRALASNTGDLKRFMTDVADTAGFAGEGIDSIGDAFLKIANQGKVSMDEITNELRNIPILPWLQETLHVSGAQLTKMLHDNKIGLEDLLKTVEQHAPGFAKASGNTIKGAMENLQTSIARSGANLLGAVFGKPTEDSNQLVEVLKTLRQRFDEVGAWIAAHQNEIRDFFKNAAEFGGDLITVLGTIGKTLSEHQDLIYLVAGAYATWKTIEGVAALITSLRTISSVLRGIPADAAVAKGAMAGMGAGAGAGAGAGGKGRSALRGLAGLTAVGVIADLIQEGSEAVNPENNPQNRGGQGWGHQLFGKSYDWIFGPPQPKPGGTTQAAGGLPFDSAPVPGNGLHWENGRGWVLDQGLDPTYLDLPGVREYMQSGGEPTPPHGGPIQPPSGTADKDKKPHLPKAPVVPYNSSLPPGFENLPMSSSLFGAESSYMDANTKLEEKRARLNQLERDNNATAQDVLDARNDVITAGRDQQQAELRLYEARQEIFDKQSKQYKDWMSQLGDIGSSLDQDFGISKGLAGIVENITKMLANMAAAPIIGALRGVQIGMGEEPGAAGSGIIGMLASGGAFGPRLQGNSKLRGGPSGAGAGGYGGAGAGGGYGDGAYPGDAALLSHVPAGRYDASGDLSKGLGDCSSAVEDLVNILDGRPTGGRSMSTANEAEWLTAHGFMPGMGGPGDFRVGFNSAHTQATLPGGTPFNWGSDAAAARGGVGGTGADDPAFTSHYYRPGGGGGGGGGMPISPYGGGGAPAAPPQPAPAPAPGATAPGQVGPGSATTWRTNVDGSRTGLDARGNATGDYIPAPMPGRPAGPTAPAPLRPAPPPAPPPAPVPAGPAAPPGSSSGGNALDPGFFIPGAGAPQTGQPGAPTPGGGIGGGAPFPGRGGPPAAGGPGLGNPSWIGAGASGPPLGLPAPGGGPDLGPTLIGGNAPPEGTGGGVSGASGGGLIGMGIAAAGSAAGGASFGAGGGVASAGIQLAVQEIGRAVAFGAQAAGIGVAGLMETFLPMGASELAQNNWITRIAGGIIGARPAMPNLAGGGETKKGLTPEQAAQLEASKKGAKTPEDVAGQNDPNGPKPPPGPGQHPAGNTTNNTTNNNVTVNNQRATEDGTGRDITYNLNQQYAPAGQP